jgi:hypothetical protein
MGAKRCALGLSACMPKSGVSLAVIADAQLPDPGEPSIVPIAFVFGTVIGGAYGFLIRGPWDEAEGIGFAVGLAFAGCALLAYLTELIEAVL